MRTALLLADFTDAFVQAEARRLLVPYQLKRTLRYNSRRDYAVHSESVAEHKFAVQWLARYFLPLEDPEHFMDWGKVFDILLVHDFGEIGPPQDIPYHLKTAADEAEERVRALGIFASLPQSVAEVCCADWQAYETRATPEARFAYAIDKLEPAFELLNEVNEKSLKRLRFTYEHHIERKRKAMEGRYPIMWRFVQVLAADMLQRDVFWQPEYDDAA